MSLFGDKYVLAIRWIQFVLGLWHSFIVFARRAPVPLAKRPELALWSLGSSFHVDLCDGRSADRMYRRVLSGPIFVPPNQRNTDPRMADACRNGGLLPRGRNIPASNMAGLVSSAFSVACLAKASRPTWQGALAFSLFAANGYFSPG